VAAIAIVIVFAVFLRRSRAANGKIQSWTDDSGVIL
jgi:hypothetical protein